MTELALSPDRLSQTLARSILGLRSWRLDVTLPPVQKYLLIGAPHTSSWDLVFTLLMKQACGIKLHWIGKDTLFRKPFGPVMRWLGGIPINRRTNNNYVKQLVEVFNRQEKLVIAISPEGTRGKASYWKTGFYYIALGARIPIALGFIDYGEKVVGIGPTISPSGDIHADFSSIKAFYSGKRGRYPQLQGDIQLKPASE